MADVQRVCQGLLPRIPLYKKYWNYEDGCVLKGCIDLYKATGDARCRTVSEFYTQRLREHPRCAGECFELHRAQVCEG